MEDPFEFLTVQFFAKAVVFPGNLGTFRYRFEHSGKKESGTIQVWVYEDICFELAQNIETETFPWTEEGVVAIRVWLNEKLTERGSQPQSDFLRIRRSGCA